MSGGIRTIPVGEDGHPLRPSASTFWHVSHQPAVNVQATASQPAAGPNLRNVLTAVTIILTAGSSAPTAATVTVGVRDGDSGLGGYLWGPFTFGVPAIAGAPSGIALGGLRIPGSVGKAMTVEFTAGAGAQTYESVWMSGETVNG